MVAEVLVGFARTLRHAGLAATPDRVQAMLACVDALDVTDARSVYWAGRLTLCGEPDDLAVYDAAFAAYFGGRPPARSRPRPPSPVVSVPLPDRPPGSDGGADGGPDVLGVSASALETLRHRDVAALSAAER